MQCESCVLAMSLLKSEVNSGTQILSSGHTKAEAAVAFLGVQ